MQQGQCYYPIYHLIMRIKFPVSRQHIDAKGFPFKTTEDPSCQKVTLKDTLSAKKRCQKRSWPSFNMWRVGMRLCCSLDVRGLVQPLKNSTIPLSLHHQTLHLAQCIQTGNVLLESAKSPIRLPNRSVICHFTQYISTAPESSSVFFIPLHPTLGILIDVRIACGHGNPFNEAPTAQFLCWY